MAQAGLVEGPDLPGENPAGDFHDFINQHPNFKKQPRWVQEQQAQTYLNGVSPTFRSLGPENANLRSYQVTEFLNKALQPTGAEQVQHAAEELGPAGLAAGAGLAASTGGLGLIPTALAAGAAGAAGEFIPQLRPLTTGEIPPPWSQSMQDAGQTALMYPAIDLATHGLAKGTSYLTRKMFVPNADDAGRQMGLEAIKQYNGTPGIMQRGGGPVMQFAEGIGESAIPMGGMGTRRQQTVDDSILAMTLDTVRKAAPILRGDEETATMFLQQSENLKAFYKQQAAAKYQVVDDLTQQKVGVNMRPIMNLTAPGIGPGKKYPGMNPANTPKVVTDDPVTAEVFRQFEVPALRDPQTWLPVSEGFRGHEGFFAMANSMNKGQASFSTAQQMSSALKQIARDNPVYPGADPIKVKAGQLAMTMARRIDQEMDTAAKDFTNTSIQALTSAGVPLQQAQAQVRNFADEYKNAKAFYKTEVADRFENDTFKSLAAQLRDEPAKFSRLAMAADSPSKLKALREAAPNMWPEMQGRILRSIYDKAVDLHPSGVGMELDELISKGLAQKMDGQKLMAEFNRLGPDYIRELSQGQVTLPELQRLGAAIDVAEQRPPSRGKLYVAMALTAPATGLMLSPLGLGTFDWTNAGMIMVGPNVLTMALTNKPILNMLERGLLGGPKSEAFAKFSAFALAEHAQELRNQQRELDHLNSPASQLPNPVGPALSQAPMPLPPPVPNVPQIPRLGQQRLAGQPPRF